MTRAPYPGLRPFRRDETDIFFGREEQTDELLERLGSSRFLAVIGPSGCGKSSLVRTGLIAALEAGFLASAGARWRVADMRPQNQPLGNLARTLVDESALGAEHFINFDSETLAYRAALLRATLERGPLGLVELLNQYPLPENTNLLLLVDQFEEIFRYRQLGGGDEADAFIALLLESSRRQDWPVFVVITMRSDFLGDCALFNGLPEAINNGQFLTPRLTRRQLRAAIEGPAGVFGIQVEPALTNRLLNDMVNNPDQLPVLQHALMRMCTLAGCCSKEPVFPASDDHSAPPVTLTLEHYKAVGGLKKALSYHADEAYNECRRDLLDKNGKLIAERLFRCLTERSADQRDTRRPVRLDEVAKVAEVDWQEVAQVVEIFRHPDRSFITPAVPEPLASATLLDISHESLIRQWQRLNEWVEQEANSAKIYRRLEETALLWSEGKAALWVDPDLELAQRWVKREKPNEAWAGRYGQHAALAKRFLKASVRRKRELVALEEEQRVREEEARQRELKTATELANLRQQKFRKARQLWRLAAVGFLVALILGGWGWFEQFRADQARMQAEQARFLAYQAREQTQTALTNHFSSILTWVSELVNKGDYASANMVLAQAKDLDNTIIPSQFQHVRNLLKWYIDLMAGSPAWTSKDMELELTDITADPNGRWLAAAGYRFIILLDTQGNLIKRLDMDDQIVRHMALQPRGQWLATSGGGTRIRLWSLVDSADSNPITLKALAEWEAPADVFALAAAPSGKLLASAGRDNDITLWDTGTGKAIATLEGHTEVVHSLAFAANGRWLASAAYDGAARIWDLDSVKGPGRLENESFPYRELSNRDGIAPGIAFDPTGGYLATSNFKGAIRLWDVSPLWDKTGEEPVPALSLEHGDRVLDLVFLNDGQRLVSAGQDQALRVWDMEGGVLLKVLQGHSSWVTGLAAQGDHVYSASSDGTVKSWSLDLSGMPMHIVDAVSPEAGEVAAQPESVALAPAVLTVAVGLSNGEIRLYSLVDFRQLWANLDVHKGRINRLAFSPDGSRLASAGSMGEVALWRVNAASGATALTEIGMSKDFNGAVHAVAFSPDGTQLVSTGDDGNIVVFNLDQGLSDPLKFKAHESGVLSVTFDSTGKQLLSAGKDDKTRLWDIQENPPALVEDFPQASAKVIWSALSPDDSKGASIGLGQDQAVRIYSIGTSDKVILRGHEGTVVRAIFSPDGSQVVTVAQDATVRFWDLKTNSELFALQLSSRRHFLPLWDFDFRCANHDAAGKAGRCWIAVPLVDGKLVLYDLGAPYD